MQCTCMLDYCYWSLLLSCVNYNTAWLLLSSSPLMCRSLDLCRPLGLSDYILLLAFLYVVAVAESLVSRLCLTKL